MKRCLSMLVLISAILMCSIHLYAQENNDHWDLSLLDFSIVTNPSPKSQYFVIPSSMNYEYFFSDKDGKVEDPIIKEIRFNTDTIIEIYKKSGNKEIGAFWELTLAHTEESFKEEYPNLFYYDPIHIPFYILKYTNSKRKTIEMVLVPGENNEFCTIELVKDSYNISIYSIYNVKINGYVFFEKPTNSEFLENITKKML